MTTKACATVLLVVAYFFSVGGLAAGKAAPPSPSHLIALTDASINSRTYFWRDLYPKRSTSPASALNWTAISYCSGAPRPLRRACTRGRFGAVNSCQLGTFKTRAENIRSQFKAEVEAACAQSECGTLERRYEKTFLRRAVHC